jgi:hypothetical protein
MMMRIDSENHDDDPGDGHEPELHAKYHLDRIECEAAEHRQE